MIKREGFRPKTFGKMILSYELGAVARTCTNNVGWFWVLKPSAAHVRHWSKKWIKKRQKSYLLELLEVDS